jgi:hypothetical protein
MRLQLMKPWTEQIEEITIHEVTTSRRQNEI